MDFKEFHRWEFIVAWRELAPGRWQNIPSPPCRPLGMSKADMEIAVVSVLGASLGLHSGGQEGHRKWSVCSAEGRTNGPWVGSILPPGTCPTSSTPGRLSELSLLPLLGFF